jgi:hypothetical protein
MKKQRVRLSKSARNRSDRKPIVETPAVVRTGQPEDLDEVMRLGKMIYEEIGVFKFNDEKVKSQIVPALNKQNAIAGVVGERGKLEGMIILRISENWYADGQILEELCVFVDPEYRNAKDSRVQALLKFALKCADELKMPLMIGILSNDRTNAKVSLYERYFGPPAGAFFMYGMKTGQTPITEVTEN